MIKIITATPGSGKTLFVVKMIDELQKSTKQDEAQRLIYCNIDGLQLDKFISPQSISLFHSPDEWGVNPFDWRDTPDGSLIIYDEAQFFFPTKVNAETEKIITELTTHRHQGKDIIFITQDPSLLNSKIRALCGEHIHLYRAFGLQTVTKYTWQHLVNNPNSRSEQIRAQKELFSFPKEYFSYYQSATQHTVKRYLPKKLKYILVAIVICLAYSLYQLLSHGGLRTFNTDYSKQQHDAATSTNVNTVVADTTNTSQLPYSWSSTPETVAVMGCIANKRKNYCQCFGETGKTLAMSNAQCLSVIDVPLPRSILLSSNVSQSDK